MYRVRVLSPSCIRVSPYLTAMPRAAVQPMTIDQSRPLYPRTQFSSHAYGSTPRVHIGDTSQPITSGERDRWCRLGATSGLCIVQSSLRLIYISSGNIR